MISGRLICDSLPATGRDRHRPLGAPPSVRIDGSLVSPFAAPTVFPIVTESAGLRHDPLEEGGKRGEAGAARTDRDRIEEGRMPGFMTFILLMHVSAGLLMASLAVPLMRRKVGPNALYGFRVRRTLEDPAIWYDANAFAGRCLFYIRDRDRPRLPGPYWSPPSTRSPMRWRAPRSCWSASPWAWCSASGTSTT